jgi:hypothetical protein
MEGPVILFAEPEYRPASRPTNPDSSHEAEERITKSGKRGQQCKLVLELIDANYQPPQPIFQHHPELSFTAGELARCAWQWSSRYESLGDSEDAMHVTICRRLPDLRAAGEIYNKMRATGGSETRTCKVRGGSAQMWWRRGG